MKRNRLVIIGIDGMDLELVEKFSSSMPNISKLVQGANGLRLVSVFPPDSVTAWATVYTGHNPADHGRVSFGKHWHDGSTSQEIKNGDAAFRGKTFWDIAGQNGLKTAVVLPYNIFPGWRINGTMICRTNEFAGKDFPLRYFPESQSKKYRIDSRKLNMFHGYFSRKQHDQLADQCRERVMAEQELSARVLEGENCDLFFTYFSSLDAIQHSFWDRCDPFHPDYPGPNRHESVIRDLYVMHDRAVGEILSRVDEDTGVIILSDHGHGPRPTTLFNVNEFLSRKGYLKTAGGHAQYSAKAKSKLRNAAIKLVQDFGLGAMAGRILALYPQWKQKVSAESAIDWENSLACISSFSPFKSYSYGGIWINTQRLATKKETFIEEVIGELSELRHPERASRVVKWVTRREDLYSGDYLDLYPDILSSWKMVWGLARKLAVK